MQLKKLLRIEGKWTNKTDAALDIRKCIAERKLTLQDIQKLMIDYNNKIRAERAELDNQLNKQALTSSSSRAASNVQDPKYVTPISKKNTANNQSSNNNRNSNGNPSTTSSSNNAPQQTPKQKNGTFKWKNDSFKCAKPIFK